MRNKNVTMITQAAIIAALYVVLTMIANALGLANYAIQVRFSEALCVLPFFTVAAIPGLTLGCLLANLLTGALVWDVLFGSLATLIGAIGTYLLRKHKILMIFPPVISNVVIVPLVLRYGYGITWELNGVDWSIPYFASTVGVGEMISIGFLGTVLLNALLPYKNMIFKINER
ncbi:MAG: QueT transporter family protein [Agathobacter sp.]|nr:QueT transporter family protein [Agathobacter sp.]MBQ6812366.1 QueT transporter family protein [Agathobacter sp.]